MKLVMECIGMTYYVDECNLTLVNLKTPKKQKRCTYELSVVDRMGIPFFKITECDISIDSEDPYLFEEGRQYILSLEEI